MSHRPACALFRIVLPLLAALWGGEAAFGQTAYSWSPGTSNNWGSTQWSRTSGTGPINGPPGAADTATINTNAVSGTYTVTVSDTRQAAAVNLSKSEATLLLANSGSLTVSGGFTFNGGNLITSGNGTLTVGGAFQFNGFGYIDNTGGGLTLNGAFNWDAGRVIAGTVVAGNGGSVTNGGIVDGTGTLLKFTGGSWSWSNGQIQVNNGGTFQVESGATLSVTPNNTGFVSTGGGVVNNFGVIQKTGGGGASTVDPGVVLNNAGTWRVNSTNGSWNIKGTVNNAGVIDISGSTNRVSVDTNGILNLNTGTSVIGNGRIELTHAAGAINVNGNVSTTGGILLQRGVFSGSGSITVGGSFDLQGFDSNSAVGTTVNVLGGGDWNGSSTPFIGTGTVNINGGTVSWGGHAITFKNSGALTVGVNGTLDLQSDIGISVDAGFSPTVTINGLFKKSVGTGTASMDIDAAISVGSTGVIDAQSGTINLQRSTLTNNGVTKGSTGTIQFGAATVITGSGTIASGATGTVLIAPGAGKTVFQSGGVFTNAGTLNVSSGTFAVSDAATITNFDAATHVLNGGMWKVGNATLDLGSRTITTIAAGTTVELGNAGSVFTGLTSLTQVNGNLRLFNSATLTPLSSVTTMGTVDVSGTFGGNLTVASGGTLTGNGTVNGSVTVQSGGVITPGPGPYAATGTGILKTGNLTLQGGSQYTWEINSWAANASAGNSSNGFDQLKGTIAGSKLNLNSATAANPILIKITSLNGSSPGQIANYDPSVGRDWVIADYSNGNSTGGIIGFSADKFTLDTSAFASDPNSTRFFIHTDANSNQLILTFTPVPEPVAPLLVGAAFVGVVTWFRKRKPA